MKNPILSDSNQRSVANAFLGTIDLERARVRDKTRETEPFGFNMIKSFVDTGAEEGDKSFSEGWYRFVASNVTGGDIRAALEFNIAQPKREVF